MRRSAILGLVLGASVLVNQATAVMALLEAGWPGSPGPAPTELAAARQDLRHLRIGWALLWQTGRHDVISYLTATGFRFSYRADGVAVYRLSVTGPGLPGGLAAAGQKGR